MPDLPDLPDLPEGAIVTGFIVGEEIARNLDGGSWHSDELIAANQARRAKLRLALAVISGRVTLLSSEELALLGYDYPDPLVAMDAIKARCEEMLLDAIAPELRYGPLR
jgi:hypothetical protein